MQLRTVTDVRLLGHIALAAILTPAAIRAQSGQWSDLQRISPESRVDLVLREGKSSHGTYLRNTPDSLELSQGRRGTRTFARDEICRVLLVEKGSRWKGAAIGAGIGFAIGFPIGAASSGSLTDRNNPKIGTRVGVGAAIGIFFAGIGAGLGALAGWTRHTPVYQAERGTKGCNL